MSSNIWDRITSEIGTLKAPKDIIQEQCDKISEATNGKIIARIKEYEGEYRSSVKTKESLTTLSSKIGLSISASMMPMMSNEEVRFDVQRELGENSKFVYEFYITSKSTPKYKYRICFLYYSAMLYPVGISLEKSISDEICVNSEFEVENEAEFINTIERMLNTDRVFAVIKNLYSMNVKPDIPYL